MKSVSPLKRLMLLLLFLMLSELSKVVLYRTEMQLFDALFIPLTVISSCLVLAVVFVTNSYARAMLSWRGSIERAQLGEQDLKMTVYGSNDEMSRFSRSLGHFLEQKIADKGR